MARFPKLPAATTEARATHVARQPQHHPTQHHPTQHHPTPRTAAQRLADARRKELAHDQAQVRLREQRRAQVDALMQLFAISGDRRADFMALHSHELDALGAPQLTPAFVAYLDHVRQSDVLLSAQAAWQKLQKEETLGKGLKNVALILKLCVFAEKPLSLKEAAHLLTCHPATVSTKLWQGIALLSEWTGVQLAIDPSVNREPSAPAAPQAAPQAPPSNDPDSSSDAA